MTEKLTALESAAAAALPAADQLAGRFVKVPHPHPKSAQERAQKLSTLGFGVDFSDHMAHATWTAEQGWTSHSIVPYGPLQMDPAAAVLHYGQEIFEGMKAYRRKDGTIWLFRPSFNAERFNASARRLALPELPVQDFLASCVDLVRADSDWVPSASGATLYLRPVMFASEAFLGVRPAKEVTYLVIASPSGSYFKGGFSPVSIWVTRDYHRAGPGGTGAAKTGGNYASSLAPQQEAYDRGYEQVCFLDAKTGTNIDELGGMNLFIVNADGTVRTPRIDQGTILEGGTRGAIIRLLGDMGRTVTECDIDFDQLIEDMEAGKIAEIFACGTAAVVTPVGKFGSLNAEITVPTGPLTEELYRTLTGIQWGEIPDTYGWTYQVL